MSADEYGARVTSTMCLDDASYILGILSPAERQQYEQHLATCASCQASIARLAGLPGLLSLTSAADLEAEPPAVPESLLPKLLTVVARERRRKRWFWTGTVAAAAACVIALTIALVVRPTTAKSGALLPPPIAMHQVLAGPMNASLQLVDKQWGTSLVINCQYAGTHDADDWYRLVVFDKSGTPQLAGSWKSVSGAGSTVTAASWIRLSQISRVEVQLPDGQPVLTAVPQHS